MNENELFSITDGTAALDLAFKRLDRMLRLASAVFQSLNECDAVANPYRGLQIQPEDIQKLLDQPPGIPLFKPATNIELVPQPGEDNPLVYLAEQFQLSCFDTDVIFIAFAPEFDQRYERIYGFLQDDITRRRPSVDLALNLLCATPDEKMAYRRNFMADSPLLRHGLLSLANETPQTHSSFLSQTLILNPQISNWLLGQTILDQQLAQFCSCIEPSTTFARLSLNQKTKNALTVLTEHAVANDTPLKLYLHGPTGAGKRSIAEALAALCKRRLLIVDMAGVLRSCDDFNKVFGHLRIETWLHHAVLLIEYAEALSSDEHRHQLNCLRRFIRDYEGIIILAGKESGWAARNRLNAVITIPVDLPDYTERLSLWQSNLGTLEQLSKPDLDILAQRFRLTPGQITAACQSAKTQALWENALELALVTSSGNQDKPLTYLMHAARAQSDHTLSTLTKKVTLNYRWQDLILAENQYSQLQEICLQFTHRDTVYGRWGFGRKLSQGFGLNALFAGPPGTGKTMAAEVIANELGLDMYKIDLSQIVSKYIGETEKNLDRIFNAAENANAILFFDEADALFGKRSEIKDAHDRYANIEVGYLLQKMEEYQGIAILATNLRGNLDDAFVRRMHFIVEFPFPDEQFRQRIWENLFPHETPLGEDVDFGLLAREIRVSGGSIKNIGLASAFYAAEDGGVVCMPHLMRAAHREHQKLGRNWAGLNGGSP